MKNAFAALGGALLLAVLPAGCGQVEQLQQQVLASGEQGEKVSEALKASLGADASVVVNMLNGELMQVMVVLDRDRLPDARWAKWMPPCALPCSRPSAASRNS